MKVFFHDAVRVFIKTLEKPTQAKVVRSIELVERYGQQLGMPHVKKITNTLYELRIRGKQEVRIFFTKQGSTAIFLHGFIKKRQKTPKGEIEIATKRVQFLTKI